VKRDTELMIRFDRLLSGGIGFGEDGTQISSNEIDPSNGNPSLAKNTRRPLA
jgi:hypothetical protein